jgi:hypothetical protein
VARRLALCLRCVCATFKDRGPHTESQETTQACSARYPRESVKFRAVVSDVQSSDRQPCPACLPPAFRCAPDGSSVRPSPSVAAVQSGPHSPAPFETVHGPTNKTAIAQRRAQLTSELCNHKLSAKGSVFWVITSCSPCKVNRRFGGTFSLTFLVEE